MIEFFWDECDEQFEHFRNYKGNSEVSGKIKAKKSIINFIKELFS